MAEHGGPIDYLNPTHLFEHVQDTTFFEAPKMLFQPDPVTGRVTHNHIPIPQWRDTSQPFWELHTGRPQLDGLVQPLEGKFTKYMVLELVAAGLMLVLFIWLAMLLSRSSAPRGRVTNLLETFLLFLRDGVARPAIGGHDADRFLPFLWTLFFFILFCNLLGMIPGLGSPTGAFATTVALALMTFGTVVLAGVKKLGPAGFLKAQVPHMDLPAALAILLKPMIFVIEILGLLIRHFVLAVRLLANIFAGHLVLAVLIAFVGVISVAMGSQFHAMSVTVSLASIVGATLISLLELFVAFLQAYIFTFLSALFIGMAVHPH
jgi:F-type H+-transporting ATPase subunit a